MSTKEIRVYKMSKKLKRSEKKLCFNSNTICSKHNALFLKMCASNNKNVLMGCSFVNQITR